MSNFLKPSDVLKLEAQRYAAMSNAALELDKLCTQTIAEANTRASEIVEQAEANAKQIVEDALNNAKAATDEIAAQLEKLEQDKSKLTSEITALKVRQERKPAKSE
jgi:vacuolar-type H+-ATPase subunit H